MEIYIGNLSHKVAKEDVEELFRKYGQISGIIFPLDRKTNFHRGFAMVEMENDTEAKLAIDKLNGSYFFGRQIIVVQGRGRGEIV